MNKALCTGILAFACVLSAAAQALLKKAAQNNCSSFWKQYLNVYVIAGYALFFASILISIRLYKFLPMSVISPVAETLPLLLSFVTGWFLFKEKVTRKKIIGAACIVTGIFFVVL